MPDDSSNPAIRRTPSLVEGLRAVMEGRAERTPIAFGQALPPVNLEVGDRETGANGTRCT